MGFLSCFSPLLPAVALSSNTSSIADPLLYDKSDLLDEKHAVERADEGKSAKEKLKALRGEMEKVEVDV